MTTGTTFGYVLSFIIIVLYLYPQPDSVFNGAVPMMWCTAAICFAIGGINK